MIEVLGLNKSFGSVQALKNIDLFIQEGEIFGIIGKSGAGKSTLLRMLNGLESPDSGAVCIGNEDITRLMPKKLRLFRHKTAMIFQHFNLLNAKTVSENIALPMRIQKMDEQSIREKIDYLLPLVGLSDKADAYPATLSGGQKQRVAIARALSISPRILLCDEATSALDPETTESILDLLQKINRLLGITIVLITHEMTVIKRICHRLALMEGGTLVETTSLTAAFANPKSLARKLLFAHLSPKIPELLLQKIVSFPTDRPILRIFFQGEGATVPFISQSSRALQVDINILLANMDRYDSITCGVLVVELIAASSFLLEAFLDCCTSANLSVEVLGYVHDI